MTEPTTPIATIDDKVPDRTTPEHNPAGCRAETMNDLSISSKTDASSVFAVADAADASSSSSTRSQRDKVRDLERKAREILARESEAAKEARRKRKQEETNKFSSSPLIEDGECCGERASAVGCCCCILS